MTRRLDLPNLLDCDGSHSADGILSSQYCLETGVFYGDYLGDLAHGSCKGGQAHVVPPGSWEQKKEGRFTLRLRAYR